MQTNSDRYTLYKPENLMTDYRPYKMRLSLIYNIIVCTRIIIDYFPSKMQACLGSLHNLSLIRLSYVAIAVSANSLQELCIPSKPTI